MFFILDDATVFAVQARIVITQDHFLLFCANGTISRTYNKWVSQDCPAGNFIPLRLSYDITPLVIALEKSTICAY